MADIIGFCLRLAGFVFGGAFFGVLAETYRTGTYTLSSGEQSLGWIVGILVMIGFMAFAAMVAGYRP